MPQIAFVKTDPLIIVVEKMMKELRDYSNFDVVGFTEVESNGFQRPMNNAFRSWYDFTRTAAVVLRLCMLKATDMLHLHNPVFNYRNEHKAALIYYIRLGLPEKPINMAADKNEAQLLSAEFDRQFPHYVLENKFDGMNPGDTRLHSSVMYVIDIESSAIYHIASTLDVKRLQDYQGRDAIVIDTTPHIVAFKLRLRDLPEEPDATTHPNTKMFKDLLAEYYANENLERDFGNLHIDSDDDKWEVENIVNEYFEQL